MAGAQTRLSDAIEDYERWRRSTGISKSTIRGHRSVLLRFLSVTGNLYLGSLTELHVTRHFEEASRTRAPQSLGNDHVALRLFFDWCRHSGRMPRDLDPMYGRRPPKQVHRERERVHVSKFPALLDAAQDRFDRDRLAVAVLLYTLCREQEAANIRLRDVDLDAGYIKVTIFKTSKQDRIPICAELDAEIRRWLVIYGERVGHLDPSYYLIPSQASRIRGSEVTLTLTPEKKCGVLRLMVRPALEAIGHEVKDETGKHNQEGAHTLRRSGARALFDRLVAEGYDGALRVVQAMLHHASVTQTEKYIGITADRRTRDDLLRGLPMYLPDTSNVTPLRRQA